MTNPLTPPPELVQQLQEQVPRYRDGGVGREVWLINRAYSAGADQELEECCKLAPGIANYFRERRRPKPPSLKEQAFEVLGNVQKGWGLAEVDLDTIRRALEALPDD